MTTKLLFSSVLFVIFGYFEVSGKKCIWSCNSGYEGYYNVCGERSCYLCEDGAELEERLQCDRWIECGQVELSSVYPCNSEKCDFPNSCVTDCDGIFNGNYQSCGRCDQFITCDNGRTHFRDCAMGTFWDDDLSVCTKRSKTCKVEASGCVDDCTGFVDGEYPACGDCRDYVSCRKWNITHNTCHTGAWNATAKVCSDDVTCENITRSDMYDNNTTSADGQATNSTCPPESTILKPASTTESYISTFRNNQRFNTSKKITTIDTLIHTSSTISSPQMFSSTHQNSSKSDLVSTKQEELDGVLSPVPSGQSTQSPSAVLVSAIGVTTSATPTSPSGNENGQLSPVSASAQILTEGSLVQTFSTSPEEVMQQATFTAALARQSTQVTDTATKDIKLSAYTTYGNKKWNDKSSTDPGLKLESTDQTELSGIDSMTPRTVYEQPLLTPGKKWSDYLTSRKPDMIQGTEVVQTSSVKSRIPADEHKDLSMSTLSTNSLISNFASMTSVTVSVPSTESIFSQTFHASSIPAANKEPSASNTLTTTSSRELLSSIDLSTSLPRKDLPEIGTSENPIKPTTSLEPVKPTSVQSTTNQLPTNGNMSSTSTFTVIKKVKATNFFTTDSLSSTSFEDNETSTSIQDTTMHSLITLLIKSINSTTLDRTNRQPMTLRHNDKVTNSIVRQSTDLTDSSTPGTEVKPTFSGSLGESRSTSGHSKTSSAVNDPTSGTSYQKNVSTLIDRSNSTLSASTESIISSRSTYHFSPTTPAMTTLMATTVNAKQSSNPHDTSIKVTIKDYDFTMNVTALPISTADPPSGEPSYDFLVTDRIQKQLTPTSAPVSNTPVSAQKQEIVGTSLKPEVDDHNTSTSQTSGNEQVAVTTFINTLNINTSLSPNTVSRIQKPITFTSDSDIGPTLTPLYSGFLKTSLTSPITEPTVSKTVTINQKSRNISDTSSTSQPSLLTSTVSAKQNLMLDSMSTEVFTSTSIQESTKKAIYQTNKGQTQTPHSTVKSSDLMSIQSQASSIVSTTGSNFQDELSTYDVSDRHRATERTNSQIFTSDMLSKEENTKSSSIEITATPPVTVGDMTHPSTPLESRDTEVSNTSSSTGLTTTGSSKTLSINGFTNTNKGPEVSSARANAPNDVPQHASKTTTYASNKMSSFHSNEQSTVQSKGSALTMITSEADVSSYGTTVKAPFTEVALAMSATNTDSTTPTFFLSYDSFTDNDKKYSTSQKRKGGNPTIGNSGPGTSAKYRTPKSEIIASTIDFVVSGKTSSPDSTAKFTQTEKEGKLEESTKIKQGFFLSTLKDLQQESTSQNNPETSTFAKLSPLISNKVGQEEASKHSVTSQNYISSKNMVVISKTTGQNVLDKESIVGEGTTKKSSFAKESGTTLSNVRTKGQTHYKSQGDEHITSSGTLMTTVQKTSLTNQSVTKHTPEAFTSITMPDRNVISTKLMTIPVVVDTVYVEGNSPTSSAQSIAADSTITAAEISTPSSRKNELRSKVPSHLVDLILTSAPNDNILTTAPEKIVPIRDKVEMSQNIRLVVALSCLTVLLLAAICIRQWTVHRRKHQDMHNPGSHSDNGNSGSQNASERKSFYPNNYQLQFTKPDDNYSRQPV